MSEKESLSKEAFEVHMTYHKQSLDAINKSIVRIFHKLEEHEKTLVRNTIIVDDHKRRSEILEENQSLMKDAMERMSETMMLLDAHQKQTDNDLKPVKAHVEKISKTFKLIEIVYDNKSAIAKIITFLIVIASSVYYAIANKGILIEILKR